MKHGGKDGAFSADEPPDIDAKELGDLDCNLLADGLDPPLEVGEELLLHAELLGELRLVHAL